jgi:hypothetical protein
MDSRQTVQFLMAGAVGGALAFTGVPVPLAAPTVHKSVLL